MTYTADPRYTWALMLGVWHLLEVPEDEAPDAMLCGKSLGDNDLRIDSQTPMPKNDKPDPFDCPRCVDVYLRIARTVEVVQAGLPGFFHDQRLDGAWLTTGTCEEIARYLVAHGLREQADA